MLRGDDFTYEIRYEEAENGIGWRAAGNGVDRDARGRRDHDSSGERDLSWKLGRGGVKLRKTYKSYMNAHCAFTTSGWVGQYKYYVLTVGVHSTFILLLS